MTAARHWPDSSALTCISWAISERGQCWGGPGGGVFLRAHAVRTGERSTIRGSGHATTDADSVVDPDWLLRQTGAGTDMVLGVVRIATSRDFPAAAARRYLAAYR